MEHNPYNPIASYSCLRPLDPWVIDELERRRREKEQPYDQPCIRIPLFPDDEDERSSPSGYVDISPGGLERGIWEIDNTTGETVKR